MGTLSRPDATFSAARVPRGESGWLAGVTAVGKEKNTLGI